MSPNSYHRRIVTDGEALSESYIPHILYGRDNQLRELTSVLTGIIQSRQSLHAWLYGPPGSGKTCVARYVFSQINQRYALRNVYVNCWHYPTLYSVLDKVAQELKLLGPEIQSTSVKLEKFRKAVGTKPFALVLDEIDKVTPKERNAILYNLSSIEGLSLICIAGNRNSFHTLEDRVKSRINPKLIEFKVYTYKEITAICRYRAELAIDPDSWSEKTLRDISRLAASDARCALRILRIASRKAERDGTGLISFQNVMKAWNVAKELKDVYALDSLSDHHKLLFQIVQKKGKVLSGELWRLYLRRYKSKRIKPIAVRSFSNYMNRLIREGLITTNRAALRGRVRIFKVKKKTEGLK